MKIVMIGNTGVGKTTYMASLYGTMQQRIEGFSLKAVSSEDHSRLMKLTKAIQAGKYPSATNQRSDYTFNLQHKGDDFINFSWSDYRGGVIVEETEDSEQANLLIQDLNQADGVMIFCDCDALANGNILGNEIGRMIYLVGTAMRDVDHIISLAIIFTKVDLIGQFQESMFSPFEGLISAINASEYVIGSFIPIACGRQFINIPMPLMFSLYASVILKKVSVTNSLQKHYEKAKEWENKSQGWGGLWRAIKDTWNGIPTDATLASIEYSQVIEKYQELIAMEEPVKALVQYVEKLPLINENKSLQSYAEESSKISFRQKIISDFFNPTSSDPFAVFSNNHQKNFNKQERRQTSNTNWF